MDDEGLKELFAPFGPVAVRRMFGGAGVYADGLCFAIEIDGEVFLKKDPQNVAEFAAAGAQPAVYVAKGKPMEMSYRRLVVEAYDDAEALKRWAGLGLAAARRAAVVKAKKAAKHKSR